MQGVLQQVAGGFKHLVLQGLMGNAPLWKRLAEDREVAQCLRFVNFFFVIFISRPPAPADTKAFHTCMGVQQATEMRLTLFRMCRPTWNM